MLAGLGGALQLPREPANLELDLSIIADAFVVTVVGGLGSIGGAFLAAIIIGVAKAFCIGIGTVTWFGFEVSFSKLTLVVEFLVMAVVLVVRPYGLLGKAAGRRSARPWPGRRRCCSRADRATWSRWSGWRCSPLAPLVADRYATILLTDIVCLRAVRRLAAFHDGAGRHGLVRPRRLFRPRRLWRGARW